MSERLINLDHFDGLGLIAKTPSGVNFTNQVGGSGCFHPQVEGIFVPLPVRVGRPELYALSQLFRGSWHSLTLNSADTVDGILRRNGLAFLKVDRRLLGDSFEAWVHVEIDRKVACEKVAAEWEFGVLTWQNSD